MYWLGCFFVSLWILSEVSCQDCEQNDVRLVDGGSALEGTVNICRNGRWGTVCDNNWSRGDARVVCRQLGFSTVGAEPTRGAFFGPGTGPIFLDNVRCDESEQTLADCESGMVNCDHDKDAGVRCQGVFLEVTFTGESGVLISWQSRPEASQYRLNISHVVNRLGHLITHSILIDLMEIENQFVYDPLLPEQNYTICISSLEASNCRNIQTKSSSPTTAASTSNATSNGILGFIIALLIILLVVAGIGLAFISHIWFTSQKKKMSKPKFSQNFQTSTNDSTNRSEHLSVRKGVGNRTGAVPLTSNKTTLDPVCELKEQEALYEVLEEISMTSDTSCGGHVISKADAGHYEMSEEPPESKFAGSKDEILPPSVDASQQPLQNEKDYAHLQRYSCPSLLS